MTLVAQEETKSDGRQSGDPRCHGNNNKRVVNTVKRSYAGEASAAALLRLVWV